MSTVQERRQAAVPSYGFGSGLPAGFPSQVIVDVTELCNLACTHCPHPSFRRSSHYSGCSLDPALNARLVDEIRDHGGGATKHLRYTAEGEPLIHSQLDSMLAYATARSGVFVSVTTNGTLLTADRIDRLLSTGVNMIDVSIDAFTSGTYARLRVNADLDLTRERTIALVEAARRHAGGTKIVVSYIEQAENAHETERFDTFWRARGVDSVVIRRMHSGSGAIVPTADLLRDRTAVARRPCLYPWERIVLTPRGRLAFCPSDWTAASELADYRTVTVRELWTGPAYRALREAHTSGRYDDHAFCGQCPDWVLTRWPHDGRRYAHLVDDLRATA